MKMEVIRMAKSKLVKANQKIETKVVNGYRAIEHKVVKDYHKMEDKFVDQYLTKDGESLEDVKQRLQKQNTRSERQHEEEL